MHSAQREGNKEGGVCVHAHTFSSRQVCTAEKQRNGVHMVCSFPSFISNLLCIILSSGKNVHNINVQFYSCLHSKQMKWGKVTFSLSFSYIVNMRYLMLVKVNLFPIVTTATYITTNNTTKTHSRTFCHFKIT